MLSRLSITTQFALVFLAALCLIGGASWLILDRIYLNQLKTQAETVADNVDAFGNWVAQYGRVWVRDDDRSTILREPVCSGPADRPGPARDHGHPIVKSSHPSSRLSGPPDACEICRAPSVPRGGDGAED